MLKAKQEAMVAALAAARSGSYEGMVNNYNAAKAAAENANSSLPKDQFSRLQAIYGEAILGDVAKGVVLFVYGERPSAKSAGDVMECLKSMGMDSHTEVRRDIKNKGGEASGIPDYQITQALEKATRELREGAR